MTLRNKDGSTYELAKPNPIMKTQETWDGYKVHNMQWGTEESEDKNKVIPLTSDFSVQETFFSALDKAKAEIKVVEEKKIDSPSPKKEESEFQIERKASVQKDLQREEIAAVSSEIEKIFIHCLPAKIRQRKDSLYGDTYQTIQYGAPISFEGVILDHEDLMIKIWTDVEQISIGSIIYPKMNYKRWWRVQEKQQEAGGWILKGMPSDEQPSFD